MQCAEGVQRQQAKSLFHDLVTDLLVCQSLEAAFGDGRFRLCVTREADRFGEWGVGLVSASRVSDPGRSGTPPGVQRGVGGVNRGYRCAQPPATVLCPSGAVVRETGSRGRLRRRLDGTRLSWGDVFPVLGRFRFGDWTRGSVSLMPGVSNRHTSPTGHHERNLAPDAPACRHATRLVAPPPSPWMRLVPRPSHPSMRSNRRSPSFAFTRTH